MPDRTDETRSLKFHDQPGSGAEPGFPAPLHEPPRQAQDIRERLNIPEQPKKGLRARVFLFLLALLAGLALAGGVLLFLSTDPEELLREVLADGGKAGRTSPSPAPVVLPFPPAPQVPPPAASLPPPAPLPPPAALTPPVTPAAGADEGGSAGADAGEEVAGGVGSSPAGEGEGKEQAGESGASGSLSSDGPSSGDVGGGNSGTGDGVILYSRARPLNETGSAVRGAVGREESSGQGASKPGRSDGVVTPALIDDFARFLADNYWPEGFLPIGRDRGSTASLRLAGLRYGNFFQGASASADPARERARLLNYVLMPSMVHALYDLYIERFLTALEREALNRGRGPQGKDFSNGQVAALFKDYAAAARGLSGVIRACLGDPQIVGLLNSYTRAADEAAAAYLRYEESARGGVRSGADAAYQEAVSRRELRRSDVAAALRRGGDTRGLDADSLVYAASWLHRRGTSVNPALAALAEVCTACAGRLENLRAAYARLPGETTARAGTR
ncbi:MAG: hypothetical protein LBQ51_04500 [Desulfovibrio sp.]|jgi:hypothetical protein|nr:hypothetical protein [Desulfovibrio sp.]